MKRKIADWMYRFWYDNHTHLWEYAKTGSDVIRCRFCNIKSTKERLFKTKQRR